MSLNSLQRSKNDSRTYSKMPENKKKRQEIVDEKVQSRIILDVDSRLWLEVVTSGCARGISFQYAEHSKPPNSEHQAHLQLLVYLSTGIGKSLQPVSSICEVVKLRAFLALGHNDWRASVSRSSRFIMAF
ncbi:hypothetical protein NPIL_579821 [Nephila pilipes]|uniref:Uncharacterized protein n=1 Tax=Nephila pilipes TaxID=299642 RepID=A0A8X6MS30_NEPPI|nr:hypothetical protein NPIL_579821 [Nephila pilipes]